MDRERPVAHAIAAPLGFAGPHDVLRQRLVGPIEGEDALVFSRAALSGGRRHEHHPFPDEDLLEYFALRESRGAFDHRDAAPRPRNLDAGELLVIAARLKPKARNEHLLSVGEEIRDEAPA